MMKQLLLSSLLVAGVATAGTHVDLTTTPLKATSVNWSMSEAFGTVDIANHAAAVPVLVSVNPSTFNAPSDPMSVNCNGQATVVDAGSSVLCLLSPESHITLGIKDGSFKNGSSGVYVINP